MLQSQETTQSTIHPLATGAGVTVLSSKRVMTTRPKAKLKDLETGARDEVIVVQPTAFGARKVQTASAGSFARHSLAALSDVIVLTVAAPFLAVWWIYKRIARALRGS